MTESAIHHKRWMSLGGLAAGAALCLALAGCSREKDDPVASDAGAQQQAIAAQEPNRALAVTPADVTIGANPPLPVGPPSLEILDIRLGATLDEARRAFSAAAQKNGFNNYEEKYENLRSASQVKFISALTDDKNKSQPGLNNQIGALLVGPPNAPQVWYIARFITYPPGKGPSAANAIKSLTDKYGEAHFRRKNGPQDQGGEFMWYWKSDGSHEDEGPQRECTLSLNAAPVYAVAQANEWARPDYGYQLKGKTGCARGVRAIIQQRDGIVHTINVGITDFDIGMAGAGRTYAMVEGEAQAARDQSLKDADQRSPEI